MAKSTDGMAWTNSTNNPFSGSGARSIAYGTIRQSKISTGTITTSTPSISELNMLVNGTGDTANVEIHKAPVLTSQVINTLSYIDCYNGVVNVESGSVDAMTSAIKLNIGFTGTLTPTLAGAMRGYIYEIIVFNTPVDTEKRHAVEGYLAWKWGIQGSLPTTHPYYIAPP